MGLQNRCVIRLRTSTWLNDKGLHFKRDLIFLRRKCTGLNVLEEDADASASDEVFHRITNLTECEDGIYEVRTCNEHKDWETGYIDDYDFNLFPLNEE